MGAKWTKDRRKTYRRLAVAPDITLFVPSLTDRQQSLRQAEVASNGRPSIAGDKNIARRPEERRRRSQSAKRQWANPEIRKKMSEAIKRVNTPEKTRVSLEYAYKSPKWEAACMERITKRNNLIAKIVKLREKYGINTKGLDRMSNEELEDLYAQLCQF